MLEDSIIKATEPSLLHKKEQVLEQIKPENISNEISNSVTDLTLYIQKLISWVIDFIPDAIRAGLGLVVGLFVIRTILKILKNRFEQRNVDPSLRGFLTSIIKFTLYALLILVVASNLGFQTTAILGAFSGLVLAAGLALQGSLSNFAGGVLILLFRPFEVGDYIENNAGTEGTVEKIDLLYTTLTTNQGLKVFSPNGTLANSVIRNFTKITQRRIEYTIGIDYSANIKDARDIILKVLQNDSRIKENPVPVIFVSELADSSVNLTVQAWAARKDYHPAFQSLQEEIKIALDKAGINIPFPQREVRIINDNES